MLFLVLVFAPLILLLILHFFVPYHFCSLRTRILSNKLPGFGGYPYFGSALEFIVPHEDLLKKVREVYHSNRPPLYRLWFVGLPAVFLKDLDYIEALMNSRVHITKGLDYFLLHPWLRQGLLTSTGSQWHSRRKTLTPAFHFKILEDYIPVFNHNSEILVNKLKDLTHEPFVNINKLVTSCTLDIICETAMGTAVNAQLGGEADYVNAVHRMSYLFQHRLLSSWLHRPFNFFISPTGFEQRRVLRVLHGFTRKVIQERRAEYRRDRNMNMDYEKSKKKRLAFLDLLIDVSEREGELTDEDIQEEVDTFMFEGHDTTSAAITWALFLLGLHPDIQDQVFQELDEIFGDSSRSATAEDLVRMRYLEQVIKETLRLYPSVPIITRYLESDLQVGKHLIPSGVNVYIPTFLIHREPELYPQPDKFDPDRFLPENAKGRHPYAYIPFSAGPRNCIGQRFALMEEKVVLSTILRNFRVTSLDRQENIKLLGELILRPKDPLKLKFLPRR
ncbi:cytochrome P450 4C1 [Anabrus simplex]|uniref:cytochrome P450 4C1 n=1 Tax=Anabrus simplex TaxID=316456 RepID=UPI0035A35377